MLRHTYIRAPNNSACFNVGTCRTTVADKLLRRLFGQLNSRHQQLSGALWAQVQVADETSYAGLVRGCGDDIRAAA